MRNPTKIAAYIALAVAIVAVSYLGLVLFQNFFMIPHWNEALYPGMDQHPLLQYGIRGGLSIVFTIAFLTLLGASRRTDTKV